MAPAVWRQAVSSAAVLSRLFCVSRFRFWRQRVGCFAATLLQLPCCGLDASKTKAGRLSE
jgi:hypothetical protein